MKAHSLLLALTCAVLLVVSVSGAAWNAPGKKDSPAPGEKAVAQKKEVFAKIAAKDKEGKPIEADLKPPGAIPFVIDGRGASVFLLVKRDNSHARVIIQNPEAGGAAGLAVSIDETTRGSTHADPLRVRDLIQIWDLDEKLWSKKFVVKAVGTTKANYNAFIAQLEGDPNVRYDYSTNTCGVATLRMLYYLGINPDDHILWLAGAMHDLDKRPKPRKPKVKKELTDHTVRVYGAMQDQTTPGVNHANDRAAAEKAIEDVKKWVVGGMTTAMVELRKRVPPTTPAAATGAVAAAKKFLFRSQRTQNPKLHVI